MIRRRHPPLRPLATPATSLGGLIPIIMPRIVRDPGLKVRLLEHSVMTGGRRVRGGALHGPVTGRRRGAAMVLPVPVAPEFFRRGELT